MLTETSDHAYPLRIVLVEPQGHANLGAVARAMKTMQLDQLVLVNPGAAVDHPQARMMAVGANDILQGATVVDTLAQALEDCVLSVATSRRSRGVSFTPVAPDIVSQQLRWAQASGPVALVFGTEDSGLTSDQLYQCQRVCEIPTNPEFGSLNLSQAVMIMAWEYRRVCTSAVSKTAALPLASHQMRETMLALLETITEQVDYNLGSHKPTPAKFRRWFGERDLSQSEAQLWIGLFRRLKVQNDGESE